MKEDPKNRTRWMEGEVEGGIMEGMCGHDGYMLGG